MSERTTTLLERFTILANTSSLHFYDWQRFYALVREGRQEIPDYGRHYAPDHVPVTVIGPH